MNAVSNIKIDNNRMFLMTGVHHRCRNNFPFLFYQKHLNLMPAFFEKIHAAANIKHKHCAKSLNMNLYQKKKHFIYAQIKYDTNVDTSSIDIVISSVASVVNHNKNSVKSYLKVEWIDISQIVDFYRKIVKNYNFKLKGVYLF